MASTQALSASIYVWRYCDPKEVGSLQFPRWKLALSLLGLEKLEQDFHSIADSHGQVTAAKYIEYMKETIPRHLDSVCVQPRKPTPAELAASSTPAPSPAPSLAQLPAASKKSTEEKSDAPAWGAVALRKVRPADGTAAAAPNVSTPAVQDIWAMPLDEADDDIDDDLFGLGVPSGGTKPKAKRAAQQPVHPESRAAPREAEPVPERSTTTAKSAAKPSNKLATNPFLSKQDKPAEVPSSSECLRKTQKERKTPALEGRAATEPLTSSGTEKDGTVPVPAEAHSKKESSTATAALAAVFGQESGISGPSRLRPTSFASREAAPIAPRSRSPEGLSPEVSTPASATSSALTPGAAAIRRGNAGTLKQQLANKSAADAAAATAVAAAPRHAASGASCGAPNKHHLRIITALNLLDKGRCGVLSQDQFINFAEFLGPDVASKALPLWGLLSDGNYAGYCNVASYFFSNYERMQPSVPTSNDRSMLKPDMSKAFPAGDPCESCMRPNWLSPTLTRCGLCVFTEGTSEDQAASVSAEQSHVASLKSLANELPSKIALKPSETSATNSRNVESPPKSSRVSFSPLQRGLLRDNTPEPEVRRDTSQPSKQDAQSNDQLSVKTAESTVAATAETCASCSGPKYLLTSRICSACILVLEGGKKSIIEIVPSELPPPTAPTAAPDGTVVHYVRSPKGPFQPCNRCGMLLLRTGQPINQVLCGACIRFEHEASDLWRWRIVMAKESKNRACKTCSNVNYSTSSRLCYLCQWKKKKDEEVMVICPMCNGPSDGGAICSVCSGSSKPVVTPPAEKKKPAIFVSLPPDTPSLSTPVISVTKSPQSPRSRSPNVDVHRRAVRATVRTPPPPVVCSTCGGPNYRIGPPTCSLCDTTGTEEPALPTAASPSEAAGRRAGLDSMSNDVPHKPCGACGGPNFLLNSLLCHSCIYYRDDAPAQVESVDLVEAHNVVTSVRRNQNGSDLYSMLRPDKPRRTCTQCGGPNWISLPLCQPCIFNKKTSAPSKEVMERVVRNESCSQCHGPNYNVSSSFCAICTARIAANQVQFVDNPSGVSSDDKTRPMVVTSFSTWEQGTSLPVVRPLRQRVHVYRPPCVSCGGENWMDGSKLCQSCLYAPKPPAPSDDDVMATSIPSIPQPNMPSRYVDLGPDWGTSPVVPRFQPVDALEFTQSGRSPTPVVELPTSEQCLLCSGPTSPNKRVCESCAASPGAYASPRKAVAKDTEIRSTPEPLVGFVAFRPDGLKMVPGMKPPFSPTPLQENVGKEAQSIFLDASSLRKKIQKMKKEGSLDAASRKGMAELDALLVQLVLASRQEVSLTDRCNVKQAANGADFSAEAAEVEAVTKQQDALFSKILAHPALDGEDKHTMESHSLRFKHLSGRKLVCEDCGAPNLLARSALCCHCRQKRVARITSINQLRSKLQQDLNDGISGRTSTRCKLSNLDALSLYSEIIVEASPQSFTATTPHAMEVQSKLKNIESLLSKYVPTIDAENLDRLSELLPDELTQVRDTVADVASLADSGASVWIPRNVAESVQASARGFQEINSMIDLDKKEREKLLRQLDSIDHLLKSASISDNASLANVSHRDADEACVQIQNLLLDATASSAIDGVERRQLAEKLAALKKAHPDSGCSSQDDQSSDTSDDAFPKCKHCGRPNTNKDSIVCYACTREQLDRAMGGARARADTSGKRQLRRKTLTNNDLPASTPSLLEQPLDSPSKALISKRQSRKLREEKKAPKENVHPRVRDYRARRMAQLTVPPQCRLAIMSLCDLEYNDRVLVYVEEWDIRSKMMYQCSQEEMALLVDWSSKVLPSQMIPLRRRLDRLRYAAPHYGDRSPEAARVLWHDAACAEIGPPPKMKLSDL